MVERRRLSSGEDSMTHRGAALLLVSCLSSSGTVIGAANPQAPLRISDLSVLRDVAEPRLSPNTVWVAYTVTQDNTAADHRETMLWVAKLHGTLAHVIAEAHDDVSTLRWI